MGNKQARALSRPKDHAVQAVCDRFELSVSYAPPSLRLTLRTDLPARTRVELEITRLFLEQGGQHWYWTMLELAAPVAPLGDGTMGLTLEYSVDELDAKGLASYRSLKRSMGLRMAAAPSLETRIALNAPAREHQFGLCNRGLSGLAVRIDPSRHYLEQEATIALPLSAAAMAKLDIAS